MFTVLAVAMVLSVTFVLLVAAVLAVALVPLVMTIVATVLLMTAVAFVDGFTIDDIARLPFCHRLLLFGIGQFAMFGKIARFFQSHV